MVESYTWAYVVYYQRGFKLPRRIIAMMIVLITTVDDTYDIHATIDDCRKLHEAIQRFEWWTLYFLLIRFVFTYEILVIVSY